MGQAKQQGTFEQHKASAIRLGELMMLAAVAGAYNIPLPENNHD